MYRERERRDAAEKHARAKADHFPVAETVGGKAAHEPPRGDADIKERSQPRGILRGKPLDRDKIRACPLHRRGFRGAVAEKAREKIRHALYFQCAAHADAPPLFLRRGAAGFFPHRQRHEQKRRNTELHERHGAVAVVPCPVRQRPAHNKRADDRTDAPEAVQPAHVACLIMQRHIVIERRVDRARTETVRHGEGEQHPELRGNRKAEEP